VTCLQEKAEVRIAKRAAAKQAPAILHEQWRLLANQAGPRAVELSETTDATDNSGDMTVAVPARLCEGFSAIMLVTGRSLALF
jgi:hypothetical protein